MTVPTAPPAGQAEFVRGFEHHRAGRTAEAAAHYRAAIAANTRHVDALHLLGLLTAQAGHAAEAERLIGEALKLDQAAPLIWSNYGNVLDMLGRPDEAITAYDRALALDRNHVDAVFNRGGVLLATGRATEALAAFVQAGQLTPGQPVIGTARGNALQALGRHQEAIALYDAVLGVAPGHVDAVANRAMALLDLGRIEEALAGFDRALQMAPGQRVARIGRAHALVLSGRPAEGLALIKAVTAAEPGNAQAWYVQGHALLARFEIAAALDSFTRAIAGKPDFLDAVYNCADALRALGRYAEAIPVYERVLAMDPEHTHAMSGLAESAMQCCDWDTTRRLTPLLERKIEVAIAEAQPASRANAGSPNGIGSGRGLMPFSFLSLSSSKQLQLDCARLFTRNTCPAPATPLPRPAVQPKSRLRVGYLSADFRRHAMAFQMAELFELHDRAGFEVIGLSGGPDDGSAIRQRIARAFDRFHDVVGLTNRQLAELMHRERIDIAVDLNGHTVYSRLAALAWRPAPVQATYLGFPGTSGAPFVDYVIADRIVAPLDDQAYFTEAIVHLPDCYQVSDRQRRFAHLKPTRADYGLPERAFVFCCFNSSYKISADIFALWMRILKSVPGSVLWLVRGGDAMCDNLRRAVGAYGIEPSRIVFCDVVETDVHLARHALADLYLDTLPYNSHGTGSFALWGGLPMLTCLGPTFAGRVCASLLHAIGLDELVTHNLADYEALAVKLASEPDTLARLRGLLAENRLTLPLFDTDRFRRHIEAAYETMWEIAVRGDMPRSFVVPQQIQGPQGGRG